MYLDYLEASFVDGLYHSTHLGGLGMKKNSHRPYSSDQVRQPKVFMLLLCVCFLPKEGKKYIFVVIIIIIFLLYLMLTLYIV